MVKLVALYRHPSDTTSFDRHYSEVHTPLVVQMPGLRRLEIARVVGSPAGDSEYHMMTEMYFDSLDDLKRAMGSAEGRAAGRDLMGFAGQLVTMHIAEVLPQ